jgi:hypothetical protein
MSTAQSQADDILSATLSFDTTEYVCPVQEEEEMPAWMTAPEMGELLARMRQVKSSQLTSSVATKDGEFVDVDTTGLESAINCTPFDRCSSNAAREKLHDRACRAVTTHTKAELDAKEEGWGQDWEQEQ